jgi:Tol biopolymer transport system component/DNA-binding winged helix-turn-helix (wHTH) protein
MPGNELGLPQGFPASARLRFGVFELDRAGRQLFRKRQPTKLQPQPMAMLIALVNKAGEEVTREELAAVWPPGTFVDVDAGIGSCIRKIRLALGDNADDPAFIRTIHGRGFSFIAPIQIVLAEPPSLEKPFVVPARAPAAPPPTPPPPEPPAAPVTETPQGPPRRFANSRARVAILVAATLALAGAAAWTIPALLKPPLPAVSVEPLTSFPGDEYDPSLSPDGSQAVFSWAGPQDDNIDLYIKQVDAAHSMRRLTTDPGRDEFPSWSPDGQWIAFNRDLAHILIVSPLGGEERVIAASSGKPSWTPDSKEVAYSVSKPEENGSGVNAVSIVTGKVREVVPTQERVIDSQPFRYSPDGRFFAFVRPTEKQMFPRDTARLAADIYFRETATGAVRRLTAMRTAIQGWTWTPDSKEIVFCANPSGQFELWRIGVERTDAAPRPIAAPGCGSPIASWYRADPRQPSSVILASQQRTAVINLNWLDIGPAGGSRRVLSSTQTDYHPRFAGAGGKFVFVSNRSGAEEIWIADSPGERPVQLTALNQPAIRLESPDLSPDSKMFLYVRAEPEERQIVMAPVGAGTPIVLRHGHALEGNPVWSRDGRSVYFTAKEKDGWQIWKMAAEEGAAPVQMTFQGGVEVRASADAKTLYYLRNWGAGGLWSMPVNGDDFHAQQVIENGVAEGWWDLTATGVYYMDVRNPKSQFAHRGADSPKSIYFYDFDARRRIEVGKAEKRIPFYAPGFAASPDGRHLLYSAMEFENIDIVLLKNFR